MKTINGIISENVYNEAALYHIKNICQAVASQNGVRAEIEGSELFIYDYEQKGVDPTAVRNEMLEALHQNGF